MKKKPLLSNRYQLIYELLLQIHAGKTTGVMDCIQDAKHDTEIEAAFDFIVAHKWIGNFDQIQKDKNGDYSGEFPRETFVVTDGLRYMSFYEKYGNKGIDIISMTLGNSALLEYYEKKDRNSFLKSLVLNIIIIVVTALATKYI